MRLSEGLLKSKERESILTFQQIKEKEEIREDTLKEEIAKLTEKSKKLNEKLLSSAKEILLLQEKLENENEINFNNYKKYQEKIDMMDNSLMELGTKFRDSDQLNKSLRAVLREKEDYLTEKDNFSLQQDQERILTINEYQRKILQFEEDSAEYSSRIRILEAASVKARAQIAESDASNLLKDELLSSALSKQVCTEKFSAVCLTQCSTVHCSTVQYSTAQC